MCWELYVQTWVMPGGSWLPHMVPRATAEMSGGARTSVRGSQWKKAKFQGSIERSLEGRTTSEGREGQTFPRGWLCAKAGCEKTVGKAGCIWLLGTGAAWEWASVVEGSLGEGELTLAQWVGFLLFCYSVLLRVEEGLAWQSQTIVWLETIPGCSLPKYFSPSLLLNQRQNCHKLEIGLWMLGISQITH